MPLLSQALKMRRFNPGVTDVLYVGLGASLSYTMAIDISDIDDPVLIKKVSYGQRTSLDMRHDPTGNSYGPLFSGVYTYTNLVYMSSKPNVADGESMVILDMSNIGSGTFDGAANGRYEDPTALFDIEFFDIDVARQYLFGSVADAANDYFFAMDTWGEFVSGVTSTEGMLSADILDTLDVPLSASTSRDVYDVSYSVAQGVLFAVARHDSGLTGGDVLAVDCNTASALAYVGYYGDTRTNAGAKSCRVLDGGDNPYTSTTWLYVGTDSHYFLKLNASSAASMSKHSEVDVGFDIDYIMVPDETFNFVYVCGNDKVATIGNAKSTGTVTLTSTLTIAGASNLIGMGASTLNEYGARYLFVADLLTDTIYVVSVSGSGTLSLYATWDYTSISGGYSGLLDAPRRCIYQNVA